MKTADSINKCVSMHEVIDLINNSDTDDWELLQSRETFIFTRNIEISIVERRKDNEDKFHEKWVEKFNDKIAYKYVVDIAYSGSAIRELYFISVDGGRYMIPMPKTPKEMTINAFQYKVAQIINSKAGYNLDEGLETAGIKVLR